MTVIKIFYDWKYLTIEGFTPPQSVLQNLPKLLVDEDGLKNNVEEKAQL